MSSKSFAVIGAGNNAISGYSTDGSKDAKGALKASGKSIDARALKIVPRDERIEKMRQNARKQAKKLIDDAWGKDEKRSQAIKQMDDQRAAKLAEINDLKSKKKDLDDNKEFLRQEYGVEADSQEQADLELLEKYKSNKYGTAEDSFSKEEIERLKQLQNMPLTEYQKKVLIEVSSAKDSLDIEIQRKKNEVTKIAESITDAKIEQLKSKDMLNAQDAADGVMEAARDAIQGMIWQDAIDHLEEENKKQEEKAEKLKEEKEEKDEQLKEAKERREEQEEIIEGQRKVDKLTSNTSVRDQAIDPVEEAQKHIQRLLEDNKLVNEDIKGIEIDLSF